MTQQFIEILNRVKPDILENPGVDLVEDGILDSLDIMRLVVALEDGLGVEFEPDDVRSENFASPEAVWAVIQKYQSAG
jgi:acyl carrier protein